MYIAAEATAKELEEPYVTVSSTSLDCLRRGLGRDGTPIPVYATLGVEAGEVSTGEAVFRLPASRYIERAGGGMLSGAFAILADACCGCAVGTVLPAGGSALTAQMRVEFVRSPPPDGAWIESRARAAAADHDVPGTGLLGVVSRRADSGHSTWTIRPPAAAANSFRMVHGVVLGLLACEVASDALRSVTGPGEDLTPLDMSVSFYRGIPAADGLAVANASVTHRGRRFVVAEGEVLRPNGKRGLRLSVGARVGSGAHR